MRNPIALILTDLDGTLVQTRAANYHAYRELLAEYGVVLTEEHYDRCFGLRLEEFMQTLDITDTVLLDEIRRRKALLYPKHFDKLIANRPLLTFLRAAKRMNTPVAVVSTARRKNIVNVLRHIEGADLFDLIVAGEDVKESKPNPECYVFAMQHFDIEPTSTLIFEDTAIGIRAALDAGANCLAIDDAFYGL